MTSIRIKFNWQKWLDDCRMAAMGVVLATKYWYFLLISGITFIVFGTLINLLAVSGLGVFKLLNGKIIWSAFIGLFGFGKSFTDWAMTFFVTLLQSILIGLIAVVWKKKKAERSENVQTAGIAAGLAILGTGCPTCNTALLAPILSAMFSGSSYAIAGTISVTVTIISVIVAGLAIKKVALDLYVIIKSEKFRQKRDRENE